MGKNEKAACKVIAEGARRGSITKQQAKTLIGQIKHGDMAGAMKGLKKVTEGA